MTKTLELKIGSLHRELKHWKSLAETGGPFEKHQTQIACITLQLRGLFELFDDKLEEVHRASDAIELERLVLNGHALWDFFREKFALRRVSHFLPSLKLADQFAWECIEPAIKARAETRGFTRNSVKQPPLVFFSEDISPFEVSRDRGYAGLVDSGLLPAVHQLAKSLPVSIIALPWFQAEFLPEMLLIAHEVGHIVEDDLKLTDELSTNLEKNLPKDTTRALAWKKWMGEAFADVYGALVGGPQFARCLIKFLPRWADVKTQRQPVHRKFGDYPTSYLRVLLALETLQVAGHDTKELHQDWVEQYPHHAMEEYAADIPDVVKAFVATPLAAFSGTSLKDIDSLTFSVNDAEECNDVGGYLKDRCQVPGDYSLRQILAGVANHYYTAPDSVTADTFAETFARVREGIHYPGGARTFGAPVRVFEEGVRGPGVEEDAGDESADLAAGRAMQKLFLS